LLTATPVTVFPGRDVGRGCSPGGTLRGVLVEAAPLSINATRRAYVRFLWNGIAGARVVVPDSGLTQLIIDALLLSSASDRARIGDHRLSGLDERKFR